MEDGPAEGIETDTTELTVMRCERCGDVFSVHKGDEVACPSCGSADAHDAHEPLL